MTGPRRGRDSGLVRPYVVTGGRSVPTRNHFDHVTLVISRTGPPRTQLSPEQRRVWDLCLPGALSVAEIGAYLDLPLSVLRIVLADLMDSGHITTRTAVLAGPKPTRELIEAVLDGLRKL